MLTSRVISVATVVVLLIAICGASPCQLVDAGYTVEGQVEVTHPTQCFAFKKPPMTQELLMIDTAAYDTREGYYVCTNVTGGASGNGCSSELRAKEDSLCLSGVDGTETVQISVSCNQLDPLGCHALRSGRFRMLAKWVFNKNECKNIMPDPDGSASTSLTVSSLLLALSLVTLLF